MNWESDLELCPKVSSMGLARIMDLKSLHSIFFENIKSIEAFIESAVEVNSFNESKNSREWWAIAVLIYNKILKNQFPLPITVTKEINSKPDFWVEFWGEKIGIEITYCSSEKYEQANSICTKRKNGSYPINTSFMKEDVTFFDESSIQLPDSPLRGLRVFGEKPIIYTINCLTLSIKQKIEKYKNLGKEYTLAVYMNLPSKYHIDSDLKRRKIIDSLSMNNALAGYFKSIEIVWGIKIVTQIEFLK